MSVRRNILLLSVISAGVLLILGYNLDRIMQRAGYHGKTQAGQAMIMTRGNQGEAVPNAPIKSQILKSSPTTNVITHLPSNQSPVPVRPKILIWSKQYHKIEWTLPTLSNGDGGCDLTVDRKELDNADAIIFFMKSCNPRDLPDPNRRRKDQVFMWWSHESPWTVKNYYHHKLTEFNNYFNYTMTFRMDSDVLAAMWPVPAMDYLLLRLGRKDDMVDKDLEHKPTLPEEEFQREVKHLMSLKSKFVSWIASDCDVTWGARHRVKVVASLEKEGKISIDRFGKCANKPIPLLFSALFPTLSPYKFYLAFENALHCQDYLTEKTIYNSLIAGNIPIVYGPTSENAAKILPKHSYIHVEDFQNMSALGDYLRYLDGNDTAYMEYFKWWKDPGAQTYPRFGFNYGPRYLPDDKSGYRQIEEGGVQDNWLEYERFPMYHLCRKLKRGDHKNTTKIIPDLANLWYGSQTKECLG